MKENTIYLGDNGEAVCHKCAGFSAKTTGRDISGQPMLEVSAEDAAEFGITSCEKGCTKL